MNQLQEQTDKMSDIIVSMEKQLEDLGRSKETLCQLNMDRMELILAAQQRLHALNLHLLKSTAKSVRLSKLVRQLA
jgi:hypothetical protein